MNFQKTFRIQQLSFKKKDRLNHGFKSMTKPATAIFLCFQKNDLPDPLHKGKVDGP